MFFAYIGAAGYFAVIGLAVLYVYWPRLRYSHRQARHLVRLTETEKEPAPEYKWAVNMDAPNIPYRSREPFANDYRDWRTQTFDELSPEALDRERRGA